PLPADDDARSRRMDRDPRAIGRPLDVDPRDTRVVEGVLDVPADLHVLVQQGGVALGGEPPGRPRARRPEAEADRMRFLTHTLSLLLRRSGLPGACLPRRLRRGPRRRAPRLPRRRRRSRARLRPAARRGRPLYHTLALLTASDPPG